MKIAFVVNDIATEKPNFTTTWLVMHAHNRGHEVFYLTPDDFSLGLNVSVQANLVQLPRKKFRSPNVFRKNLVQITGGRKKIPLGELDVVFLRNDPSIEP